MDVCLLWHEPKNGHCWLPKLLCSVPFLFKSRLLCDIKVRTSIHLTSQPISLVVMTLNEQHPLSLRFLAPNLFPETANLPVFILGFFFSSICSTFLLSLVLYIFLYRKLHHVLSDTSALLLAPYRHVARDSSSWQQVRLRRSPTQHHVHITSPAQCRTGAALARLPKKCEIMPSQQIPTLTYATLYVG